MTYSESAAGKVVGPKWRTEPARTGPSTVRSACCANPDRGAGLYGQVRERFVPTFAMIAAMDAGVAPDGSFILGLPEGGREWPARRPGDAMNIVCRGRAFAALAVLGWVLFAAMPVHAQSNPSQASAQAGDTLSVGTKAAPPFVIEGDDGRFSGISIALWEAVAERLGRKYEYAHSDLAGLFSGLEDGRLDVSVAALTVTADREARIDFTYPFYSTGLGDRRAGPDGNRLLVRRSRGFFLLAVLHGARQRWRWCCWASVSPGMWLFERRRQRRGIRRTGRSRGPWRAASGGPR